MRQTHGARVVAVLAVLTAAIALLGGVTAATQPAPQQSTPTNNTTVQHERPSSVSRRAK